MMLKRRTFIERSASLLAALGLSGGGLASLCDRYGQALAQPIPRKRALLIGINQYGGEAHNGLTLPALQGCLTDVELQRELLQHRFGFDPADILTLTDAEATRQNIISTILSELIEPIQPQDLILLHFSGYGGQVCVPTSDGEIGSGSQQPSFAPADCLEHFTDTKLVQDLVESTLSQLIQAIPAQQVLVVLDTSHALESVSLDPALRSRARIFSTVPETQPAQIIWPPSLNSTHRSLPLPRSSERLREGKPMVLSAVNLDAQSGQAFEASWAGFHAGVLTYALTQQLWATVPPRQSIIDFGRLQQRLQYITHSTQSPQLSGSAFSTLSNGSLINASSEPILAEGAEGVVTAWDESHAELTVWLGGMAPDLLNYLTVKSLFQLVLPEEVVDAAVPRYLQLRSQVGLWAKTKLLSPNPPTAAVPLSLIGVVREAVRMLPYNMGLTIALDPNLGRIERVDATSALGNVAAIATIVGSDQQVDCRLGRVPDAATLQIHGQMPGLETLAPMQSLASLTLKDGTLPQNHYGLLSPSRIPIPTTLGQEDEAIAAATRRLIPHLQTLLAAKVLRLLVNTEVSQLRLLATLTLLKDAQTIDQTQRSMRAYLSAARSSVAPISAPKLSAPKLSAPKISAPKGSETADTIELAATSSAPSHPEGVSGLSMGAIGKERAVTSAIPSGFSLGMRVENPNSQPLYLLLFGIDQLTGQITYFPLLMKSIESDAAPAMLSLETILQTQSLPAAQHIHYPTSPRSSAWMAAYKPGDYALYLLASPSPFTQTWRQLSFQVNVRSLSQETPVLLSNGLAISQALLKDLHQASLPLSSPLLNVLKESTEANTEMAALHVAAWTGFEFRYQVMI